MPANRIETEVPVTGITFGMIVLNGMPFLEYNLTALYPFAHEIIVVEGACTAAAPLATADGHSTDGTVEVLERFAREKDPDGKLTVVTAEDDGEPNGFWSEKDEMSQAFARRATGDWLWQVDVDEFYREEDVRRILSMIEEDPTISGFGFPFIQFWGGFESVEEGLLFRYVLPGVNRVFKWGDGFAYHAHRPSTVVDDKGRNLCDLNWVSWKRMKREGIYLYHYSYVFPHQARQKVGYYTHVEWTDEFRGNDRWLRDSYFGLKHPYFIGETPGSPEWLRRYDGPHPGAIVQLRDDLAAGRLTEGIRPTEDIERLLASRRYAVGTAALRVLLPPLYLAKRTAGTARGIVRRIRTLV